MPLTPHQFPLSSWGAFKGRRRESDSPYIESVWEGVAQRDGSHFTAADAAIDIVCLRRGDKTHVLLSGPTSEAYSESFRAGDETLAIRLRTGIHLSYLKANHLTDTDIRLPVIDRKHFWLNSTSVTLPEFNTAEVFIEHLVANRLLRQNISLQHALQHRPLPSLLRTLQRRCLATTGLTMSRIYQIKRAEKARTLLTSDYSLMRIAYDTGYSNPAHMTTAFKRFFGQTPSALRSLMQQDK